MISLITTAYVKIQSHHKYEYQGLHYQFHSPFETPFDKNAKFICKSMEKSLFEVNVDINELGENLLKHGVER